jgi:hypothetical protein
VGELRAVLTALTLTPFVLVAALAVGVLVMGARCWRRECPERELWGWPKGDSGEPRGPAESPHTNVKD